ncbi:MAG: hydrogenase maturation protease [Thermodesulfobacteriota bacterium]
MIKEILESKIAVFGCGNVLFGDDGFGPRAVEYLNENYTLPEGMYAEDMGTAISDILFDLTLSETRPESIWILDAVDMEGWDPGEVFELQVEDIPGEKSGDFSLHQFPAVNLLRELRDEAGINIRILAVQVSLIPEYVEPGLSKEVRDALPRASRFILDACDSSL